MAINVDMAIAEKRAVIRAHIQDLGEAYGIDWGDRTMRTAKYRLELVAGASKVLARLQQLEGELAQLLGTKHDIECSEKR